MTDQQWKAVEAIFAEVSDLSLHEREARLRTISDETVRREIASLLAHAGTGVVIEKAIGAMASQVDSAEALLQRFGPYRVLRKLGQGGQGAVLEAVRDDGAFEQRVAIKIVNWEVDDELSRTRLRQERQILAGLAHPNIARLLDGGETAAGMPYFVMEFIAGQPLTKAAANWPIKRKLRLFLDILDAVAYAHRNLIVHRDLKPANILVTAEGVAKLLDFGIARLANTDPHQTQTAFRPLSPGYASPEQVRGLPISTSSDIYSLGVVLFELLTRKRPYNLKTTTPLAIERVVCEEQPASPMLGDELDHIVLMALRKEPDRRYGGAVQFADDIRCYLDQRPVSARPDTLWYRARKYLHRHWLGVLAATITLASLCAGAAVAVYQAHVADQRFQQVRRLAHSFVFDYHDELAKLAGSTALRERMVRTALEYLDNLAGSAGNDLGLQKELAAAYRKVGDAQGFPAKPNLGHVDQAIASFTKAGSLYDRVLAKDSTASAEVGEFYAAFTSLLTNAGDYARAAKTGQTALQMAQATLRANPADANAQLAVARAWNLLGDLDDETNRSPQAWEKFQKAAVATDHLLASSHSEQALKIAESTVNRVATSSQVIGHLTEAEAAFAKDEALVNELLQIAPRNPSYQHADSTLNQFWSQLYFDDLLPSFEDPARSLPYARRMVASARKTVARDELDAGAKFTLAIALFRVSFPLKFQDAPAAVEAARESVQLFDLQIAATGGSFLLVSRRARALLRLSEALTATHQNQEALAVAGRTFREERSIALHDNPNTPVDTRMVLALLAEAQACEALRQREQARAHLSAALKLAQEIQQVDGSSLLFAIPLARAERALADYWQRTGDDSQARHWMDELDNLWRAFPTRSEFVQRQRLFTSKVAKR